MVDVARGTTRTLGPLIPSAAFQAHLSFFDQFAPSHSPWSPDSTRLAFAGDVPAAGGVPAQGGPGGSAVPRIWVADASGATPPQAIADGTLAFWIPPVRPVE